MSLPSEASNTCELVIWRVFSTRPFILIPILRRFLWPPCDFWKKPEVAETGSGGQLPDGFRVRWKSGIAAPTLLRSGQLLEREGRWDSARRGGWAGTGPLGTLLGTLPGTAAGAPPLGPSGWPSAGRGFELWRSQGTPPRLGTR